MRKIAGTASLRVIVVVVSMIVAMIRVVAVVLKTVVAAIRAVVTLVVAVVSKIAVALRQVAVSKIVVPVPLAALTTVAPVRVATGLPVHAKAVSRTLVKTTSVPCGSARPI